mgnify:CR=1 FL=1
METIKRKCYTWEDVHKCAHKLALELYKTGFRPDYIVGINRGGLPVSVVLSHLLDCNHYALDVRLRDNKGESGPESNCWMAEDAFGYVSEIDRDDVWNKSTSDPAKKKKILIVDDINDSGATILSCQEQTAKYSQVKYAVLQHKETSPAKIDYYAQHIDKSKCNEWIVYPWEEWSK